MLDMISLWLWRPRCGPRLVTRSLIDGGLSLVEDYGKAVLTLFSMVVEVMALSSH